MNIGRNNEEDNTIKGKIVSAAWKLFHEKGYAGTTVDDIVALSGTSKGSFYYYFKKKDDLLNTLAIVLDEYYDELEKAVDERLSGVDKLYYLNYEMHKMMEENIDVELLASLYSSQLVVGEQSQLLDQNRKYYRLIRNIIEEAQRKQEIRSEKTADDLTRYFAMCERALVSDWCMSNGSYSLSHYSKVCMPLMLESLRNE